MKEKNFIEEFSKLKKYSNLGLLVQLMCLPFMLLIDTETFWGNWYIFLSIAIVFGIGILIQNKYRCPNCGYKIDTRIKSKDLINCPKCGIKLQ